MEQSYTHSQLFEALREIRCPVRLTRSERSEPVYLPMFVAARQLLPVSSEQVFSSGHCVAQQLPEQFGSALLECAQL